MARKKKSSSAMQQPEEMFVEGTPLDELGVPQDGAEVSLEDARYVPVDAESSRVAAQYRNAVSRKGAGEKGVPFNAPNPVKYNGIVAVHPEARVRIMQTSPSQNDNIEERSVSYLKDWEALKKYVRDHYWNGEEAVYRWEVHGGRYPFATGELRFREEEMRHNNQNQQPPPPYGMQPMYPGMPPPYYVPQPAPAYAPPQQQAPPPAPAPAPPPVQVPPGTDPMLAMMFQELMRQNAELRQQIAGLIYAGQPQPQQQVPVAPPGPPPPPPKGPLEQIREMGAVMVGMNEIREQVARQFSVDTGDEPEPAPLQSDEGFPLKVKDFGPVRMVANADGDVSAPLLANLDKYEGMLDAVLNKAKKFFDDVGQSRTSHIREQVTLMQEAERIANGASTAARNRQVTAPAAPAAVAAPPAAAPAHPWDKFAVAPQQSAEEHAQVVEEPAEVAD